MSPDGGGGTTHAGLTTSASCHVHVAPGQGQPRAAQRVPRSRKRTLRRSLLLSHRIEPQPEKTQSLERTLEASQIRAAQRECPRPPSPTQLAQPRWATSSGAEASPYRLLQPTEWRLAWVGTHSRSSTKCSSHISDIVYPVKYRQIYPLFNQSTKRRSVFKKERNTTGHSRAATICLTLLLSTVVFNSIQYVVLASKRRKETQYFARN